MGRNPRSIHSGNLASPTTDGAIANPVHGMLGQSHAFNQLVKSIRVQSVSNAPVLLDGETGSGKELAARAVHYLSDRHAKPFVPVNCGAIPEALLESELFGHVRGAFTDARASRVGLVTHADGGTLFLDEIDTLSAKGQIVLLRFLQDYCYRPIGQSGELHSTARIIAATNTVLEHEVRCRRFRNDLFYRLNILRLRVPPLRERDDDVLLLARHFIEIYSTRYGLPNRELHAATAHWMQQYDWPGNIRELENTVHRLVLECEGVLLHSPDAISAADADAGFPDFHGAKAVAIAVFERTYLARVLAEAGGNVSAAARMACTDRRALGRLLKKHGIDRSEYETH